MPKDTAGRCSGESTQSASPPPGTFPLGQAVCAFSQQVGSLCSQGQVGMVSRDSMAERGLTADGDAQLHTMPLRQLHVEGTTARDDRLWVQRDMDPCETQPHTHSGPAERDPKKSLSQPHPDSST